MQKEDIGPNKIHLDTFIFKLVAGLVAGGIGSLLLMLISFLSSSILEPFLSDINTSISPIFMFVVIAMVFISSISSNILGVWLLSKTEKDKYKKISSAIYQIFIVAIVLLLLMVPVYFISAINSISVLSYAVALHMILSVQVSVLILEMISNVKYSTLAAYNMIISSVLSILLLMIIPSIPLKLFSILPISWLSVTFANSSIIIFYGWIARSYDKDFLAIDTNYGNDYGKPIKEKTEDDSEEEIELNNQDGADFLRGK